MSNATLRLQLKMLQNGKLLYTNLQYQCIDAPLTNVTAQQAVTAWENSNLALLQDVVSQNTIIYSLEGRHSYTGGIGQTIYTSIVNLPGSVESPPLPVFTTASFIKYADPTDQIGPDPNLIERGRMQLGGVPESFVDFGLPTPAATGLYNDFAAAIQSFTALALNVYEMRIFRDPPGLGGATKNARVDSIQFRGFGTQNTRKG